MRILVTGAAGFVGTHLIDHLLAHGDAVVGLARRPVEAKCEFVTADLLDEPALVEILRRHVPEAIVHLAGYADAGRSYSEPKAVWRDNLEATLSLYRAVEGWGGSPRILYVSSGMIYGPAIGDACDESTPLMPNSPYSASKAAADLASYQAFCHPGLRILRVRPFNQVGPGQSPRYAVAAFAQQLARIEAGLIPPVLNTGRLDVLRNLTDVRDMCAAYRLLLEHGEPGEAYNAASPAGVRMSDVLNELIRLSGCNVERQADPARMRPTDVSAQQVSTEKLRAATGWLPAITLTQSLTDVLADWRAREATTS